jgi:hypothetical protein
MPNPVDPDLPRRKNGAAEKKAGENKLFHPYRPRKLRKIASKKEETS